MSDKGQEQGGAKGNLLVAVVVVIVIVILLAVLLPKSPEGGAGPGNTNAGGSSSSNANSDGDYSSTGELVTITAEAATVIPSDPLKENADWPSEKDLTPFAKAANKPQPREIEDLAAEARLWLAPGLVPDKPEQASFVDAKGHLYLKLGKDGTDGLVSRNRVEGMYTLSINRGVKLDGSLTGKSLVKPLKKLLNAQLIAELDSTDHGLRRFPPMKGKADFAGCAILDSNGAGAQYPFLYAYASKDGLVVVMQQTPHSTPRKAPK